MNDLSQPVEVSLGGQRRMVIPVSLRRALGFEEGDALVTPAKSWAGWCWRSRSGSDSG